MLTHVSGLRSGAGGGLWVDCALFVVMDLFADVLFSHSFRGLHCLSLMFMMLGNIYQCSM